MVCTFIGTLCKYTICIMRSLKRCSRCYWSEVDCDGRATCSWSRLTALLLGRLLGMLLFTEARSMESAVQWSPMKPESWSGWLPLMSSPTCSCCWLHCDLQNVSRELLELYVLTGPRHPCYSLTELNCVVSLTALRRTQVKTLLAKIHVAIVGCHGNPVYRSVAWIPICVSVTWSPKFSSCGRFPWEALT
jgi:hypothetical protein